MALLFVCAILYKQSSARPRKLAVHTSPKVLRIPRNNNHTKKDDFSSVPTEITSTDIIPAIKNKIEVAEQISAAPENPPKRQEQQQRQRVNGGRGQQNRKPRLTSLEKALQRLESLQQSATDKNVQHDQEVADLPPLDTLIGDLNENITGNVQSLLDFAIVGFGKCGTTALIDWLDGHPEINTIPKEALHLSRKRPALMVQKLYEMKVNSYADYYEQQIKDKDNQIKDKSIMKGRIQGFKNPSDIRRPESMAYLRQYWPQTKLIITVRHPVHWFKSLYNFLLNEMGRSKQYLHHTSLIGGPHKNTAYAHTGKGEFHAILSLLGKTNMTSDGELDLLKGFLRQDELLDWPQPLPNKIFFLETTQMSDTQNATRAAQFRRDLQSFLGLQQELPPVLHVRPGKDRQIDETLKLDMCQPENDEIRHELVRISRVASQWIRKYFLSSPDVVVSSREHLEEIFATSWMQDPCDEKSNSATNKKVAETTPSSKKKKQKERVPVALNVGEVDTSAASTL